MTPTPTAKDNTMSNESIMINTPDGIAFYRLASMKSAVKLESKGMKMSRGRSITPMARKEFGLKARAPHSEVIAAIEAKMQEMMDAKANA